MKFLLLFIVGLVFGTGISVSGMANPAKVLNFFDIAGSWDPSLGFVMGGALLVASIGYRLVFRRDAPLMDRAFHLPENPRVDRKLIGGAVVFGTGWAIAGFCPGAALPVLATGNPDVALFVFAAVSGMGIARLLQRRMG